MEFGEGDFLGGEAAPIELGRGCVSEAIPGFEIEYDACSGGRHSSSTNGDMRMEALNHTPSYSFNLFP